MTVVRLNTTPPYASLCLCHLYIAALREAAEIKENHHISGPTALALEMVYMRC
jgi:hypothetical protein